MTHYKIIFNNCNPKMFLSEKLELYLNNVKQFITSLEKFKIERRCFNEFEKINIFISSEICKIGYKRIIG